MLATAVMIFFSVAIDLGFVYWLAEYFAAELLPASLALGGIVLFILVPGPGAVSGILYAGVSLGGMAFPFVVGVLAEHFGIARSCWFCAEAAGVLQVAALAAAARSPRPARA